MNHYRMNHEQPSAVIMRRNKATSNLDEVKIYQNNTVFLENSDEFSIRLFNPMTETVGAKISINGMVQENILVVKPGQSITVDRFLDNNRKMVYETYTYDASNPSASKAIVNNGLIEITFLSEKKNVFSTSNFTTFNACNYNSRFYNTSTFTSTLDFCSCDNPISSGTYNTSSNLNLTGTINDSGNLSVTDSNAPISSYSVNSKSYIDNIKETGRVEKGDVSKQSFKEVNIEFGETISKVEFVIKPMSEKSIHYNEIKVYCTNCGTKVKSKYNYCPKCGEKINQ